MAARTSRPQSRLVPNASVYHLPTLLHLLNPLAAEGRHLQRSGVDPWNGFEHRSGETAEGEAAGRVLSIEAQKRLQ